MTKAEILREKCHTEKYTFSRQDPLLNNVLLHCIYIWIQICYKNNFQPQNYTSVQTQCYQIKIQKLKCKSIDILKYSYLYNFKRKCDLTHSGCSVKIFISLLSSESTTIGQVTQNARNLTMTITLIYNKAKINNDWAIKNFWLKNFH